MANHKIRSDERNEAIRAAYVQWLAQDGRPQREIAPILGTDQPRMSHWRTGKRPIPAHFLKRLFSITQNPVFLLRHDEIERNTRLRPQSMAEVDESWPAYEDYVANTPQKEVCTCPQVTQAEPTKPPIPPPKTAVVEPEEKQEHIPEPVGEAIAALALYLEGPVSELPAPAELVELLSNAALLVERYAQHPTLKQGLREPAARLLWAVMALTVPNTPEMATYLDNLRAIAGLTGTQQH